jgi:hypothetical protein
MESFSTKDAKNSRITGYFLSSDWLHLSRVPKQDSQTLGNEIKHYA